MERGLDYTGIITNAICHDGTGRFLFSKKTPREGAAKWGFGTVVLAFGESPEEACVRLLKAEYGCMGTMDRMLGVTHLLRTHDNRQSHWVVLSYLVRVSPGDVIAPPESGVELAWHYLANPPQSIHDGTITILQKYKKYLPQAPHTTTAAPVPPSLPE